MSVEFNEENQGGLGVGYGASNSTSYGGRFTPADTRPTMVRWLMKAGVKSERTANIILICMALVFFALSIVVYFVFV